jgi:hypothetical protein
VADFRQCVGSRKLGVPQPRVRRTALGFACRWADWDVGAGADVTFYGVPEILKPTHGDRPVSFHAFIRIRPPAPMGRMLDMVMTKGMH